MPKPNTARDDLWRWARRVNEDPYGDLYGDKTENLLDAYRDQVLTEAAELLLARQIERRAAELAKFGFVDRDTKLQSEAVECDAQTLLAARTTTAQEQPR